MRFLTAVADGGRLEVKSWLNRAVGPGSQPFLQDGVDEVEPAVVTSGPANRVALRFVAVDGQRMLITEGTPTPAMVSLFEGTIKPFSLLMTLRCNAGDNDFVNNGFFAVNDTEGASPASTGVRFSSDSNGQLQYTRVNNTGTQEDAAGSIEMGSSLRRIGYTYDGARLRTFVDSQPDLDTAFTPAGSCSLAFAQVGRVVDPPDAGNGLDADVFELVIATRAITYAEWLRYYAYSVKQWGQIQAPQFTAAGTGSNSTTSPTPAYPSNSAQDLFLLHVVTVVEVSAPSTPAGWTLQYDDTSGSVRSRVYTRDARATGSDSGTITVTVAAGNFVNMARIYGVRAVSRTPTTSNFIEGAAATSTSNGTISGPTVGPNGYGRLAVAFLAVNTDSGMAPFTGESGGNWDEPVAEHTSGLGAAMQVQIAALQSGTPISGGTAVIGGGSNVGVCRAFALLGE